MTRLKYTPHKNKRYGKRSIKHKRYGKRSIKHSKRYGKRYGKRSIKRYNNKKGGGWTQRMYKKVDDSKKIVEDLIDDTLERGVKLDKLHRDHDKLSKMSSKFLWGAKKYRNRNNIWTPFFTLLMGSIIGMSGLTIIYALK